MKDRIKSIFEESIKVKEESAKELPEKVQKMAEVIINSFRSGGRLYVCGNGGSACDSMHFAEEMVARFKMERPGLPAQALTDPGTITCWANDYDFDTVFSRQVDAHGKKGDVLVAISTSGNSKNIVNAIKKAKEKKMEVIGLSGKGGGMMNGLCDLNIVVPSENTARIQECHITIIHAICELVEKEMFGNGK